jgi:hypothetical protein
VRRQVSRLLTAVAVCGTMAAASACQARDPGQADGTTPPGAATDPVAERSIVTLTGCVQRGVGTGEYVLASVGTAGVLGTAGEDQEQARSWTVEPGDTDRAQGRVAAASSYRLVTMGEGENLEELVGKRVAARGRLAAEAAPGTAPARQGEEIPADGQLVESGPTQAVVQGSAPTLRGFYYESVRRVADTCEP